MLPAWSLESLGFSSGTLVASSWSEGKPTTVRLTPERRELLAEKLAELANFAVAALVFGQAVGQDMFSPGVAAAGVTIWSVLMAFAFALRGVSR